MEVELYVYDLSKGLAREMSGPLLGIEIDAVYHTAIVFGGVEYFFGAGIQTSYPGGTHHGRPMEILPLGKTHLPMEVILEYLDSLREIYTIESYDLFLHNCNNFTQDLAMFLVGTGIPDRITSLPQTVLNTPFGRMLKPQLENSIRGITQAPVPSYGNSLSNRSDSHRNSAKRSLQQNGNSAITGGRPVGVVHNVTKLHDLEGLLANAKTSCAVIFFTSARCPPCKIVYPAYDELAAELNGKAVLVKVDISQAYDIASKFRVRVTPTFITFLHGEKADEWSGASESQLRGNVRMLVEMAHPPHPHTALKLPTLRRPHDKPIIYTKAPPLEKLVSKLGSLGTDPCVAELKAFVNVRQTSGAAAAPVPHLPAISALITRSIEQVEPVSLFPLIDLWRLALVDPRISGYFAEEPSHLSISACLRRVVSLEDKCPYPLRIVTLQMSCNLFSSPLFPPQLLGNSALSGLLVSLITFSLLDTSHSPIRAAAASLAYNMAAFNHMQRLHGNEDILPESAQLELMAGLLEAMRRKLESIDELRGLLLSVGLLGYMAPQDGELFDLCRASDAKKVTAGVKGIFEGIDELAQEVETIDPVEFDQITTLPNGLRVATEALPGAFSGIGVYIDAGSRFENEELRGVTHIIDRLAFKSTKARTAEQMFEAVESLGGNMHCASSRESLMYQSASFNSSVPTTVGLLAETIRTPRIEEEEVQQQLETASFEIREIWSKPELILPELVNVAAYKDNTLGNPLLCPHERLPLINKSVVEKYRNTFFHPERMVVAFAGVNHEEALRLTEKYFGDMERSSNSALSSPSLGTPLPETPNESRSASSTTSSSSLSTAYTTPSSSPPQSPRLLSKLPFLKNLSTFASSKASVSPFDPESQVSYVDFAAPSHYTGGFLSLPPVPPPKNPALPHLSHIHLAFESLPISSPDIYALATLQTLLGGGGSFSAGGPGKGMYSRVYTDVLNKNGWVESCAAFNQSYTDSGFFGLSGSCSPARIADMLEVICRELHNLTLDSGPKALQIAEVDRAKNQLRSSLLMNLESRMVELEDLGRQVQVHGRKVGVREMCEKINALTVDDVRRVAKTVFRGGVMNVGRGTGAPTVVLQEGKGFMNREFQWEEIQERIANWKLGRL